LDFERRMFYVKVSREITVMNGLYELRYFILRFFIEAIKINQLKNNYNACE
jgi:hypothetical protein